MRKWETIDELIDRKVSEDYYADMEFDYGHVRSSIPDAIRNLHTRLKKLEDITETKLIKKKGE